MHDEGRNGRLHLPDLSIAGFRGIERLSIPRLGRVTLLAGRNGAGKTTVLDAVRVYASRGQLPDHRRSGERDSLFPAIGFLARGMCAVGFSPGTALANALGNGVLGTRASRPH